MQGKYRQQMQAADGRLAWFRPLSCLANSWQIFFSEHRETRETPSAITGDTNNSDESCDLGIGEDPLAGSNMKLLN